MTKKDLEDIDVGFSLRGKMIVAMILIFGVAPVVTLLFSMVLLVFYIVGCV